MDSAGMTGRSVTSGRLSHQWSMNFSTSFGLRTIVLGSSSVMSTVSTSIEAMSTVVEVAVAAAAVSATSMAIVEVDVAAAAAPSASAINKQRT